jgi:hypothetical protein
VPEARGQGGGQEHPSWEQRVRVSTGSSRISVLCSLGN